MAKSKKRTKKTKKSKGMVKSGASPSLWKRFGEKEQSPLHWLLPSELVDSDGLIQVRKWFLESLGKKNSIALLELEQRVASFNSSEPCLESAFEILGVAYSIRVDADSNAGDLLSSLANICEAVEVDMDEEAWLYLLLKAELPIVLATQGQAGSQSKDMARQGMQVLETVVRSQLDGDGLPQAPMFKQYGPFVASLARCYSLATSLECEVQPAVAYQLEWTARQVVRICRSDGTMMGSDEASEPITKPCAECLLLMSNDPLDLKVAKSALPFGTGKKPKGSIPELSGVSEWAQVGVLRRSWKRNSAKVACTFQDDNLWLEVARDYTLLEGEYPPEISRNGEVLKPVSGFSLVCENLGEEIDFLEFEMEFGHGITLERQIVFGTEDQFLMLADVIHSPEPARIDYRCEIPVGRGIQAFEEKETTELYLRADEIQSLVLPLGLPEWRIARTDDRLTFDNGRLVLNQSIDGCGMFAGLFLDLSPSRSLSPRTWRKLTVAESLKILNDDVAVAFRVQIGDEQWVFYRSIGASGNRTFMGENTVDEFFVGRFDSDGEMTELLEIE